MRRLAMVTLAALAFAGCSSDSSEREDYVKQVNAVEARFHRSFARVQATIDTPTATERQERSALVRLRRAVDAAVAELRAVEPPGDVAGLHRRLVEALQAYGPVIAARRSASASRDPRELIAASTSFATGSQAVNTRVQRAIDEINEKL